MNFYKRHIGDYLKDTAHLSLLEHGVYSRLLDVYYTRESGIPDAQAARLIGARGKDETAALKVVLGEFFKLVDGTWVQDRCEREIADASEGEVERDAKRENERERQRRHRERRKQLFDELRQFDIVPSYDSTTEQLQALLSRVTTSDTVTTESRHVTPPVTRDATANQTPDTRHQTPDKGSVVSTVDLTQQPDDSRPKDAAEWLAHFKRKHGFEADPHNVADRKKLWPVFTRWSNAGLTSGFVDAAVKAAHDGSSEPIVCLPLYVDRLMANGQAARASPQKRTYHDDRRETIEGLTGRNRKHEHDDIIDIAEQPVARLAR